MHDNDFALMQQTKMLDKELSKLNETLEILNDDLVQLLREMKDHIKELEEG